MRIFFAFVWLRWRLMANGVRGGHRRDTVERISRALALALPIIVVVLSFGSLMAMSVIGFLGGRTLATGLVEWPTIVVIVRMILVFVLGLVVLFSIVAPNESGVTKYTRLLLLPIPRRSLHLVEVASSLVDPWLLLPAPGLAFFALGILVSGWVRPAVIAALAGVLFLLLLAVLGSLISFLVNWFVRDRRRGELFTLFFVLAVSLVSMLPVITSSQRDSRRNGRPRTSFSAARIDRAVPAWAIVVPSELYGRAVSAGIERHVGTAALAMAGLVAEGAILFALSAAVHRRLIESVEGASSGHRATGRQVRIWRVPGLGAAATAVATAQVRTALRSVRGRLVILLPGPIVALLALALRRTPDVQWVRDLGASGDLLLGVSLLFGIYALQPFTMNLFGSDRSGLTLQFLSPIRDVDLARGKIAGCAILLAATQALAFVAAVLISPGGSPWLWLATFVGGFSVFFLVSPLGVWLSALFPVASDLSKTGAGGNPHPLPTIAGTFIVIGLATPPALIRGIGAWSGHPGLVLPAMLVWTIVAASIAWVFLTLAARAIGARRENLALVAQGR